jgi:hypothetical protein
MGSVFYEHMPIHQNTQQTAFEFAPKFYTKRVESFILISSFVG